LSKTRDSFNEFAELLRRFPQSRYAPDAKQRMVYLRNRLAAYEVHVGNYYIKRKAYLAAANRGRYVVENFQGTPAVGDGLALMVEGYRQLKLDDLADSALATLRLPRPAKKTTWALLKKPHLRRAPRKPTKKCKSSTKMPRTNCQQKSNNNALSFVQKRCGFLTTNRVAAH